MLWTLWRSGYSPSAPARISIRLCYGAAVAVLDNEGRVTTCIYIHRTDGDYAILDLAKVQEYRVDTQVWLREAIDQGKPIWTQPYYDAGGGEIWMVTRSVPLRDETGTFAVLTTDLPLTLSPN